MRIEATRIYMRTLGDQDCTAEYLSWLNDPEVNRYLETRFSLQSMDTIRDFVRTVNGKKNELLFGIFLKDGNHHIGNIKVGPINPHHRVADLSLFIGAKNYWGQGLASEAIAALSTYAFERLGVRKLAAGMYAPNRGSCQAFLKCGYRQEGIRRAHHLLDGRPCDIIELGLSAGPST
jgi:ribosomal-protein-alanine N-acetyltransferase